MSYEARCIFPRRDLRRAIRHTERIRKQQHPIAYKALADTAESLIQEFRKHVGGFCMAMGTFSFYSRGSGDPINTDPQYRREEVPITVANAIDKWEEQFYIPFVNNFGYPEPLRITLPDPIPGKAYPKIVRQTDW